MKRSTPLLSLKRFSKNCGTVMESPATNEYWRRRFAYHKPRTIRADCKADSKPNLAHAGQVERAGRPISSHPLISDACAESAATAGLSPLPQAYNRTGWTTFCRNKNQLVKQNKIANKRKKQLPQLNSIHTPLFYDDSQTINVIIISKKPLKDKFA